MDPPDITLFEAIYSQRAIRRFSAKPVPEEAIDAVLEAAIRAPSAGNRQPWHFIVIRDREAKRRFGHWNRIAPEESSRARWRTFRS